MPTQSRDTDIKAESVLIELLREKSPAKKPGLFDLLKQAFHECGIDLRD